MKEKDIPLVKVAVDYTDNYITELRDSDTGVHYFVYHGRGGMYPRFNADGTLYVD